MPRRTGRAFRPVRAAFPMLLVIAAMPLLLGGTCNGDGGGGGTTLTEKATVHMRVKKDLGTQSNLEYAFTVQWNGTGPSSGEGTAAINQSKNYEGYTDLNGDAKVSELFINLRPGAWTFSAQSDGWAAECNLELTAGEQHYVNFTYGESGCSNTTSF